MPSISLAQKLVVADDSGVRTGRRETGSGGNGETRSRVILVGLIAVMAVVAAAAAIAQVIRGAHSLDFTDALVFQTAGRIIAAHGCVYCIPNEGAVQFALLGGHLQANG